MQSVASLAMAGAVALALSFPSTAAEGWGADKPATWLEFREAVAEMSLPDSDRIPKDSFAAVAVKTPVDVNDVAVVELPVDPEQITVPGGFMVAFGEALEAARAMVTAEPRVYAALRQKGFATDDVLAVTKTESGNVTVFVGAAG
jgi:hypothetical protein